MAFSLLSPAAVGAADRHTQRAVDAGLTPDDVLDSPTGRPSASHVPVPSKCWAMPPRATTPSLRRSGTRGQRRQTLLVGRVLAALHAGHGLEDLIGRGHQRLRL